MIVRFVTVTLHSHECRQVQQRNREEWERNARAITNGVGVVAERRLMKLEPSEGAKRFVIYNS